MDQGIASQPRNYRAPGFNVVVKKDKHQFTAKVVSTSKAKAGDNDAVYLAKGLHDSGYLWAKDDNLYGGASTPTRCVKPVNADRGDDQHVLFNVTSAVAAGSKAAEQQHIDDYHLAYDLTLGAAHAEIKAVAKQRFKAGTSAKAQGAANQALLGELQLRSNGHLSSLIGTDWEAKYDELFRRSGQRDTANTHLQTVVESTKAANGWAFPSRSSTSGPRRRSPSWSPRPRWSTPRRSSRTPSRSRTTRPPRATTRAVAQRRSEVRCRSHRWSLAPGSSAAGSRHRGGGDGRAGPRAACRWRSSAWCLRVLMNAEASGLIGRLACRATLIGRPRRQPRTSISTRLSAARSTWMARRLMAATAPPSATTSLIASQDGSARRRRRCRADGVQRGLEGDPGC